MNVVEHWVYSVRDWVWGPWLLFFIVGSGCYLTIALRGVQFRYLFYGLKQLLPSSHASPESEKGEISQFEALSTSMAGAIGTGNITGIAVAVVIGGPGTLFWIWVTGIVGMATKFSEAALSVRYRDEDGEGGFTGGPMLYMRKGLNWNFISLLFACATLGGACTTGNMVQVNAISGALWALHGVPNMVSGVTVALLTSFILLGGVKSIGKVAGVLVPVMGFLYLLGGVTILCLRADQIPAAFSLIFREAFSPNAVVGGGVGSSMIAVMQVGVSRGVFSNEAGMGSTAIADASAQVESPAKQAVVGMLGPFLATLVVCSITGLVLTVTGFVGQVSVDGQLLNGAPLAMMAFGSVLSGGNYIVTVGLVLFAYTTILGWAFYAEKAFTFLFTCRYLKIFRLFFCALLILGANLRLNMVWALADIMNASMAFPNILALLALSGVVRKEMRNLQEQVKEEQKNSIH